MHIRGQRVELEAVEAALLRHPLVAAAAARIWPKENDQIRLSAYVIAKEGSALDLPQLRTFLASCLPENMVPSDVMLLSEMPLLADGTVDRDKLPPPPSDENLKNTPEQRLTAIWRRVLEQENIGPDDNFFDLGGHSLLLVELNDRVAAEFGRHFQIYEFFESPTIRQQLELMQREVGAVSDLPPGVTMLQPHGKRNNIYWVHIRSLDLARMIGNDQPLVFVTLAAADFKSLGPAPDLQTIAACLVQKILATQPSGPYTMGGLCLGGILAYEIAYQLRALGHRVSLLVLVDPPNPSYVVPRSALRHVFAYLPYVLQRASKLGLRISFRYFYGHVSETFQRLFKTKSYTAESRLGLKTILAAALKYQPKAYDGKVLLLLAAERPPHINFLPGWQAVVPNSLQTHYMNAHHRDLLTGENARSVAEAIKAHLATEDESKSSMRLDEDSEKLPAARPGGFATA